MKKLFFEGINKSLMQFTVHSYEFDGEFYQFTDIRDGKDRRLHKSLFKGEEELNPRMRR